MNVNRIRHWLRSRRLRRLVRELDDLWAVLVMNGRKAEAAQVQGTIDVLSRSTAFGLDHVCGDRSGGGDGVT